MICNTVLMATMLCLFALNDALRWNKAGFQTSDHTVISLKAAKSDTKIDVASGVQVTILRDIKTKVKRTITIYCFIAGYKNGSKTEYHFCKYDDCDASISESASIKKDQFNLEVTFETHFPGKKGLMISISLSESANDYSGNYYCKASNNKFSIQSNYIEIRDTSYWKLHLISNREYAPRPNTGSISVGNLPQVLNCSNGVSMRDPRAPKWTHIEIVSPVFWSVCPVFAANGNGPETKEMNVDKCAKFSKENCDDTIDPTLCSTKVNLMSEWTTFVNHRGDLVFTGLRPKSSSNIGSYSFLCYAKAPDESFQPIFYFYNTASASGQIRKGVIIDGTPTTSNVKLNPISPLKQEFVIYAREVPKDDSTSALSPVIVYALYNSSSVATYRWIKDSVEVTSNSLIKTDKYTLTFPGVITSKQAGKYILKVTDKSDTLSMEIDVKVLGPPILVTDNCMRQVNYLWVGEDISLQCEYKQRPKEIKMQINNQDINLNLPLDDNKINLRGSNPYLEKLHFTTYPRGYVENDTALIRYKVQNITKSLNQLQYQDHTVTFLASNDFGRSVKTTSIYVLPPLKSIVDKFPENDNCKIPCSSSEKHYFHCEVRVEEYANKELYIDHFWTINSHRVDDPGYKFSVYFEIENKTKMLTLLPIKSNDTARDKGFKKILSDNHILCNVILTALNSDFKYISYADKSLGTSMRSLIRLDYTGMSLAFVYWIIVVILVLVVVVILVARFLKKNEGETYMLDKLEKKHGIDRDKEVEEEIFKPYERQNADHNIVDGFGLERRPSCSDTSIGGSEEGERNVYDQQSNFNDNESIADESIHR